jgi:hypothetical protein
VEVHQLDLGELAGARGERLDQGDRRGGRGVDEDAVARTDVGDGLFGRDGTELGRAA